ncbi:MAG: response regulator [Desulfatibacillum sp.]|nr:response regulator [Desulfatibacillum sp.]
MSKNNILIVEDDRDISDLLRDYLKQADFSVRQIFHGDELIPEMRIHAPDIVLLDLMLPGADGITLCRDIRRFSSIPIIMITAKVDEIDRLLGLELGADDYICKPFSPREVVSRVKAVLRRTYPESTEKVLHAGPIFLDAEAYCTTIEGIDLKLTQSEFSLLRVLMERPERVFSRNELIAEIQGYTYDGYDRSIDTHIKNLRKKLDAVRQGLDPIKSVYGVGYKFSLDAENN